MPVMTARITRDLTCKDTTDFCNIITLRGIICWHLLKGSHSGRLPIFSKKGDAYLICPYSGKDCEADYFMGEDSFEMDDAEVVERYYSLCIFCKHYTEGS
jgi:hypothetical protein